MSICPTCGQSYQHAEESEKEMFLTWCLENGVPIILGNAVRVEDAARYIGREPKTIHNWNTEETPPLCSFKSNGRRYVDIDEICRYSRKRDIF